jgi:hypothetical protein
MVRRLAGHCLAVMLSVVVPHTQPIVRPRRRLAEAFGAKEGSTSVLAEDGAPVCTGFSDASYQVALELAGMDPAEGMERLRGSDPFGLRDCGEDGSACGGDLSARNTSGLDVFQAGPSDAFVWYTHIQKAGGTSLNEIIDPFCDNVDSCQYVQPFEVSHAEDLYTKTQGGYKYPPFVKSEYVSTAALIEAFLQRKWRFMTTETNPFPFDDTDDASHNFTAGAHCITQLRDPWERLVSMWKYTTLSDAAEGNANSIRQWEKSGIPPRLSFARFLAITNCDFVDCGRPSLSCSAADMAARCSCKQDATCRAVSLRQTASTCQIFNRGAPCWDRSKAARLANFKRALRNLEKHAAVLVLEWRKLSFHALQLALGLDPATLAEQAANAGEFSSRSTLGTFAASRALNAAALRKSSNFETAQELYAELFFDTILFQWSKRRLISQTHGTCRSGWDAQRQ